MRRRCAEGRPPRLSKSRADNKESKWDGIVHCARAHCHMLLHALAFPAIILAVTPSINAMKTADLTQPAAGMRERRRAGVRAEGAEEEWGAPLPPDNAEIPPSSRSLRTQRRGPASCCQVLRPLQASSARPHYHSHLSCSRRDCHQLQKLTAGRTPRLAERAAGDMGARGTPGRGAARAAQHGKGRRDSAHATARRGAWPRCWQSARQAHQRGANLSYGIYRVYVSQLLMTWT